MLAKIAALCLLLGVVLAQLPCVTVTDFSYANLNRKESQLHFTSFGYHFDKQGVLHLPVGQHARFELRPSGSISELRWSAGHDGAATTASFTLDTYIKRYGVETYKLKTEQVSLGQGFSSEAAITSFVITPNDQEVQLLSLTYCPNEVVTGSAAARPSSRKRTVDDEEVDDATVSTTATDPVVPRPFCNSKVDSDNDVDYCFAAFGYDSSNNLTISLNASYVRFVPEDNAINMAPTLYYSGGEDSTIGVLWICTEHLSPLVKLIVDTPMVNTSRIAFQRHSTVMPRNFPTKCPEELLEWIADTDVPSLFEDDDG